MKNISFVTVPFTTTLISSVSLLFRVSEKRFMLLLLLSRLISFIVNNSPNFLKSRAEKYLFSFVFWLILIFATLFYTFRALSLAISWKKWRCAIIFLVSWTVCEVTQLASLLAILLSSKSLRLKKIYICSLSQLFPVLSMRLIGIFLKRQPLKNLDLFNLIFSARANFAAVGIKFWTFLSMLRGSGPFCLN